MNRTTRLAFLVLLGAVLALGACAVREDTRPSGAASPRGPTLALAWGEDPLGDPHALDPAFASGSGANVLLNVMDPLVKLDADLVPHPFLAARWEVSESGKAVTFTLRRDARWTNGDPVTAFDFEYSWKRVLAPGLDALNADELYAIRGARSYHECEADDCARLAERVGVRALDALTLEVRLRAPAAWFPAQVATVPFLAVHPATVNRLGERWTDPDEMVTNGPFAIDSAESGARLVLVKDEGWRDASSVSIGRVDGRIIEDASARLQAFDEGEVTALDASPLPASDLPSLRERAEYARYPALGVYYFAFNVETVADVHQRRAMALAIDRDEVLEQVGAGDEIAAIGLTPPGTPGFGEILGASPWLEESADLKRAKAELDLASDVKEPVNLFFEDAGANRDIAEAVRDGWRELGITTRIRGQDETQYDAFVRPPNESVDVFQALRTYDVPDPGDALRDWLCDAEANYSHFCDRSFDDAVRGAAEEPEAERRNALYAAAEAELFGDSGAVPLAPVYWPARSNLEALSIKDTFFVNPLGQIDLTNVQVE